MKTYTWRLKNERIDYSIEAGELRAEINDQMKLVVEIHKGDIAIKPKKIYSRYFYVGFVGIILPLFTFITIYLKEGIEGLLALNLAGLIHVGFIITGSILLIVFRKPLKGYTIMRNGSGIGVWCVPGREREYEDFMAEVRAGVGAAKAIP